MFVHVSVLVKFGLVVVENYKKVKSFTDLREDRPTNRQRFGRKNLILTFDSGELKTIKVKKYIHEYFYFLIDRNVLSNTQSNACKIVLHLLQCVPTKPS